MARSIALLVAGRRAATSSMQRAGAGRAAACLPARCRPCRWTRGSPGPARTPASASQIAWTWERSRSSLSRSRRGGVTTPGDHLAGVAEVVLVVAVAGGAVGGDQGGLPGSARAAGALRVVRGGRRDVPHGDGVQAGDVDAELHRRRAVQQLQLAVAELVLALAAQVSGWTWAVCSRATSPDSVCATSRYRRTKYGLTRGRRRAAEGARQRVVAAARAVARPPDAAWPRGSGSRGRRAAAGCWASVSRLAPSPDSTAAGRR